MNYCNTLLLERIENMFFKWKLSKWRLGWSDQGEEDTCQTKVIQFSKNAASSQEYCFVIQDNILLFCGKKRKNIL